MTRMTRPDCAVMCNLINTHTHTHTHTRKRGRNVAYMQSVLELTILSLFVRVGYKRIAFVPGINYLHDTRFNHRTSATRCSISVT